jgi:hypothetical protein
VVGLGIVGGAGLFAVKYHQQTTNKYFSALQTAKIDYFYILRGPTSISNLALIYSFKALVVIGWKKHIYLEKDAVPPRSHFILNLIRYEDGFSGSIGTDHSQCFE